MGENRVFHFEFSFVKQGFYILTNFVAFSLMGTLSIMSSMYLITRAASGYLPAPISAVFHNETVAIVPEGLPPNETLCITYVSGGLAVSVSLHRDLCICCSIVLILTIHFLDITYYCNVVFSEPYEYSH